MNHLRTLQGRRVIRVAVTGAALSLIIPAMAASAQSTTTLDPSASSTTVEVAANDSVAADSMAADSMVADTAVPAGGVNAGYGGTAGSNGGLGSAGYGVILLAVVSGGVFLGLKKKRSSTN